MENSQAHSSKSNGVIERGVPTIQGMVRTLRGAIEEKWMVKLAGIWTQGTRRFSVAEPEFYSAVKGGSILVGAKSMTIDFGEDVGHCVLGTDSSSAKSILERRGAGRIRHLHCSMLWLQERVDSADMRTEKRKGEHKTADIDIRQ